MGFFGKLFGRNDTRATVVEDGMIVLKNPELARALPRPTTPNFGDKPQAPCERCGASLQELFITTGGPLGDPDVWREHPIAVDGWACIGCGIFRYPRQISPARITALSNEGVAHGRAGRIAEAEACFARIAWDWPGYAPGHLNYATALLDRLNDEKDIAARRQLTSHATDQCDAAVDAFVREPTPPTLADVLAGACMRVAEAAIHDRAYDRAARYARKAHELPGISDDVKANAADGQRYLATKRYLFEEASKVYGKRIALSDRRAAPPTSPDERAQIMRALEGLREHLELDRDRWQSVWLYAKGLHLVGKDAEALEVWRDAFARFPDARDLARDYSHELLATGRNDEARDVARAIAERIPDDATLWCNLAVAELLCGDLDAAEASLARSRSLDPDDAIARTLHSQFARYREGAPIPRTLHELERR